MGGPVGGSKQQPLPPPKVGQTFNVELLSGEVTIASSSGPQLAGRGARATQKGRRFVPLTNPRQLTIGSFLNTRRGAVRITTGVDSTQKTQSGAFSRGLFQVLQSRSARARGLTELRLKGSSFKGCPTRRRSTRNSRALASRGRVIRRLRGNAKGRFSSRSRHSAATVRGTIWTTADRCDGTLTTVKRGRVAVRDFRLRKTVIVRAGKSYLARARP